MRRSSTPRIPDYYIIIHKICSISYHLFVCTTTNPPSTQHNIAAGQSLPPCSSSVLATPAEPVLRLGAYLQIPDRVAAHNEYHRIKLQCINLLLLSSRQKK